MLLNKAARQSNGMVSQLLDHVFHAAAGFYRYTGSVIHYPRNVLIGNSCRLSDILDGDAFTTFSKIHVYPFFKNYVIDNIITRNSRRVKW